MDRSFALVGLLILAGFFVVGGVIKVCLHFWHLKRLSRFNHAVKARIDKLNAQLSSQVGDLQESLDIINNEYRRTLNRVKYDDLKKGGLTNIVTDSVAKAEENVAPDPNKSSENPSDGSR